MKIETKISILGKSSRLLLLISKYYHIDNPEIVQFRYYTNNGNKISFYTFDENMYKRHMEMEKNIYSSLQTECIQDLVIISNFNTLVAEHESWVEITDFLELNKIYRKYKTLKIIN